jgi:hypothetical protein
VIYATTHLYIWTSSRTAVLVVLVDVSFISHDELQFCVVIALLMRAQSSCASITTTTSGIL